MDFRKQLIRANLVKSGLLIFVLIMTGYSALSFAFENQAQRRNRQSNTIRKLGFDIIYKESCPEGFKAWFKPSRSNNRGEIVICLNAHETAGDITLSINHELGHAIHHCLDGKFIDNNIANLSDIVIKEWREYLKIIPERIQTPIVKEIIARVDAGEKLSLEELFYDSERYDVSELYPPESYDHEIEARVMAFIGMEGTIELLILACEKR